MPTSFDSSRSSSSPYSLAGHGEHVRARLAASLDEFDQEEKCAQAERRTDQVEQGSARHADLPHTDGGEHRSGGHKHRKAGEPRHVLRSQAPDSAECDRRHPAEQQPFAAELRRCSRFIAEQEQP